MDVDAMILPLAAANTNHLSPVAAVAIGFGIAACGGVLFYFSASITRALNGLYGAMPGKFQYPSWFVRLFAVVVIIFGLAVGTLSAVLGSR